MATHPLQRLSSPSRTISLLFHSLGIASFSYNLHYLTTWKTAVDDAYGWHFQFLTILSLIASLVAFGLGALADVTANTSLFRAKNALSAIVTPLEFLVTLLYFGISAVDPTMVVPPEFQIPLLVDLGFHFAPAVFLSLDALVLSPPWTASASTVMALSTLISLAYWYWVEICFTHNGYYVYPLLDILSFQQRTFLFSGCAVWLTLFFVVIRSVYGKVNGYGIPVAKTAKKTN